MSPARQELSDEAVEGLLRESRPTAPPAFEAELESRLFGARNRRLERTSRRRPLLTGAFAALGLTGAAAILTLAGVGPLAYQSQQDVRAISACHYVTVKQRRRVPRIDQAPDGKPKLAFRYESVERRVKRCE